MTPRLDCRRAFLRRVGVGLTATAFGALFFRGSVARAQADSDCAVVDLQRKYGDDLMKLKGVIGHGIGLKDGKEALMIFVKDEGAAKYIGSLVRDTIEGHPVVIFVSGELTIR